MFPFDLRKKVREKLVDKLTDVSFQRYNEWIEIMVMPAIWKEHLLQEGDPNAILDEFEFFRKNLGKRFHPNITIPGGDFIVHGRYYTNGKLSLPYLFDDDSSPEVHIGLHYSPRLDEHSWMMGVWIDRISIPHYYQLLEDGFKFKIRGKGPERRNRERPLYKRTSKKERMIAGRQLVDELAQVLATDLVSQILPGEGAVQAQLEIVKGKCTEILEQQRRTYQACLEFYQQNLSELMRVSCFRFNADGDIIPLCFDSPDLFSPDRMTLYKPKDPNNRYELN